MQNIDYSRKLRPTPQIIQPTFSTELPKLRSPFFLFVGAILLFTAGMVFGINLNQKEKSFQQNQERSFSNLGKGEKPNRKESKAPAKKTTNLEESSWSQNLKFPPKDDQINYLVQIGHFAPEESMQIGKNLASQEPRLAGRLFRTSNGRLYAGYFYRMEDAKEALASLQRIGEFQDLEVKTIRF